MNKQNTSKTQARKSKANLHERRSRFHKQVSAAIKKFGNVDCKIYINPNFFEEVEGRPMADVITDHLCHERGCGNFDCSDYSAILRLEDSRYEAKPDCIRNRHERNVAEAEAGKFLLNIFPTENLTDQELHELIRRFYKPGDIGLRSACGRAILSAVRDGTALIP